MKFHYHHYLLIMMKMVITKSVAIKMFDDSEYNYYNITIIVNTRIMVWLIIMTLIIMITLFMIIHHYCKWYYHQIHRKDYFYGDCHNSLDCICNFITFFALKAP